MAESISEKHGYGECKYILQQQLSYLSAAFFGWLCFIYKAMVMNLTSVGK